MLQSGLTGCKSTYAINININIKVIGNDYCSTAIVPYYTVNAGASWANSTVVSMKSTGSVTFGPQPNDTGYWIWSGPNQFTSFTREFTLKSVTVKQSGIYTATYTNNTGCESYINFSLTVDGVNAINSIEDEKSVLQLYPNPVTDIVTLKGVPSNTTISISDLSGLVLLQMKSSNETDNTSININNLKAGIYFINLVRLTVKF